jgi:hypothetical protein
MGRGCGMRADYIIFNDSAFRHGVTKEDIRCAVTNFLYDALVEGYENKYLIIGFDRSANLLEINYNEIDDVWINVFHAMKCRDIYLPLLK